MSRKSCPAKSILLLGIISAAVVLGAGFLIACGEVSTISSSTAATEGAFSGGDTQFTAVTFETEDGLLLGGRVYGAAATSGAAQSTSWIILCHMYPADQTSWHQEALGLVQLGYRAMTFDFRGYGSSEGQKDIQYLDRDVKAAARYAQSAGAQEVVLVGASMGGTASLVAGAELQTISSLRLAGVATLSAPVEFDGLSAHEAAEEVGVAVLMIAAEEDSASDAARELYSLSDDRGELHIVAGADHGTNLFSGAQSTTVRQLLYDFIRQCMPIGG